MLKNYFKIAWRNSLKNKTFTLISIVSLVIGITLFFLIGIWTKGELSYDKNFKSPDKICRVQSTTITKDGAVSRFQTVGWPIGKILSTQYPEIESVCYLRNWSPIIYFKENHFYENALFADQNFFSVFGYQLKEGNPSSALSEPFSLVISKELEQKYFGNEPAIGKTIMISDTIPYKITGVFKDLSAPSHLKFDMIGSFSSFCSLNSGACEEEFASGWFDLNVYNYIRLKPTASVATVESKIKNLVLDQGKEAVKKYGFKSTLSLMPFSDIYLHSGMPTGAGSTGNYKTVRLFVIIGIFILLIACLNFINLTTARSAERVKEIGVKKVLGSDRKRLIIQFLFETAVLCSIAAIISLLLTTLLLPVFNQFTGKTFTLGDLFSTGNMFLLMGIILVLVPLAGFYPSFLLSSFKPIRVLKGGTPDSGSGLLRKALVVSQFVVSTGFIIASIIMWKQMKFMQTQDLGFDKNKLIIADMHNVPWKLTNDNAELFKQRLLSQPGIKSVTACGASPGRTGWGSQFAYPEGKPADQGLIVEYIPVDRDFIKTIGLHVIKGRDFLPNSRQDEEESFVINEAAVKLFGWQNADNALGKKLSTSGKDGRIIGVIKDYHQHGLQSAINPIVLSLVNAVQVFALRYDNISAHQAIAGLQAAWKETYAGYPVSYHFFDEDFQKQYVKEEKGNSFFGMAALLSIVIACLGLLGLAIYAAKKRVKEIGVRKVLGASTFGVVKLITKDLLKLVCIAIVLAIPTTWWIMNKWLQNFAYKASIGVSVFIWTGLLILIIALLTVSIQSVKAALANPVKSLRTE